jgi:hypothetical protein
MNGESKRAVSNFEAALFYNLIPGRLRNKPLTI